MDRKKDSAEQPDVRGRAADQEENETKEVAQAPDVRDADEADDIDEALVERAKKGNKKKSRVAVAAAVLLFFLFVGSVFYIFFNENNKKGGQTASEEAEAQYGELRELATRPTSYANQMAPSAGDTAQGQSGYSPINLKKLRSINPDVYAWLRIPGTYVDYPVAQSAVDDNYYLHRNIYKRYLFAGMIYTQSCNNKDFYDPITVIYGHNMRSTTMFSTLHYFEKADFFNKNEYFYIYTIDRVLTYRIVSAYKYDNRHIMNSFNFNDPAVLAEYQQNILNPASTLRQVRDGITLDQDSRIVILSTCMANDKKSRFLVNGVLISDVPIQEES